MTRMLLLATFSLAATTLPLPAQTPNGPVQGAVQGTVKGTATVGQGVVQGAGQASQGIVQGSASVARGTGQATVGVAKGAGTVAAKTQQRYLVHSNAGLRLLSCTVSYCSGVSAGSLRTNATTSQSSSSSWVTSQAGMPVIFTPCLTKQNCSAGVRSVSRRSSGARVWVRPRGTFLDTASSRDRWQGSSEIPKVLNPPKMLTQKG
jgi:hypothetical protein